MCLLKREIACGFGLAALVITCCIASGCGETSSKEAKSTPPAKVQGAVKETELATLTLTAQAEKRLGIEIATVELKRVQRTRVFGGEVVVPPGKEIAMKAPLTGRLAEARKNLTVTAGMPVGNGDPVFQLFPLPSERDVLQVEEDLKQAQIRYEAAKVKAKRAEQLLKDRAGSVRANEESQSELASAESALKAVRGRYALLTSAPGTANKEVTPVVVSSPLAGIVSEVHARTGQVVSAGAPLFTVQSAETVWIRVPVYSGDLPGVEERGQALVRDVGADSAAPGHRAKPIPAPPSANTEAASVDLYYEMANRDGVLRPRQKVGVTLVLKETEQGMVVPWSAVVHDIYGGTWVYVNTAPQTYARRKVEVKNVVGQLAVLGRGLAVGTRVVTAGAAELFGTEFSTGK